MAQLKKLWTPSAGPQTLAYWSKADELLYGGQAGGGKTDLLLGLAGTAHVDSLLLRRTFPQLRAIIERSREIFARENPRDRVRDSYNEGTHIWRLLDGRTIELGSCQREKDKYQYRGRPHDLKAFDEVTEFSEDQYRFIIGWNRSTIKGQRCRVVATGNPPTSAQGRWVIRYWAPWLDKNHPRPAQPGELRWFTTIRGKDVELPSGDPIEIEGRLRRPRSRTFIPASLEDNPYLRDTDYGDVLAALPEPLRSQLMLGIWDVIYEDNPYQVIPESWVRAAMARWQDIDGSISEWNAIGVDVARGGGDTTVFAPRWNGYFGRLAEYQGSRTPDGQAVAALAAAIKRGNSVFKIDVVGVGASAYDVMKESMNVVPVNFGAGSKRTDKSRKLRFCNVRAAAYWALREALDPSAGSVIALPPDEELVADLTVPNWELVGGRVVVEDKEAVKARLGRSPNKGDAVVLSWWAGDGVSGAFDWISAMAPNEPPQPAAPAQAQSTQPAAPAQTAQDVQSATIQAAELTAARAALLRRMR